MGVATLPEIIASVKSYLPNAEVDLIRKAYNFVMLYHKGQTRASGEPYVTHVIEVALLATKLRLDIPSVVTALLHDLVEDTGISLEIVRRDFGEDIAQLVDGVTKLSKINFRSREEQQAENFRKMLLAMAKDIRVLLVKLCDRTHNMRTLEYLSASRRMRIAQETLDIFAPLAHRLGIHWLKSELEDLSLRYLKPEVYENIKRAVNKKKIERERDIVKTVHMIEQVLSANNIKGTVAGRPKHFFSIYQKMERQGLVFDEIYDLVAFRVIVPTTMECYAVLGMVHAAWKPIPGRFKDYIAMPKPNGYQSLHTTVIGPDGARIEIQIRTPEMHEVAEKGIAAHWVYKAREGKISDTQRKGAEFAWIRELVESEQMLRDPVEFLSVVKDGLFSHEVFVFSPRGDVHELVVGSTPIDFAYAVHTQVGHACAGARVNGRQVPLTYILNNGDTVEILTSKSQTPSKDWLSIVVTSKAKQRIRSWLRTEERARSIEIGRELLAKDLRKMKHSLSVTEKHADFARLVTSMGYKDPDLLFADIGYGKVSTKSLIKELFPEDEDLESKLASDESALKKIFSSAAKATQDKSGIQVSGLDDVVVRYARCCEPLPGDSLVGFVTRGRGVTIHRRTCSQIMGYDPQRLVSVSWQLGTGPSQRTVRLRVRCLDVVGMLAKITNAIATNGASIVAATSKSHKDGKAENNFEIVVREAAQLDAISRELSSIEGVIAVEKLRR